MKTARLLGQRKLGVVLQYSMLLLNTLVGILFTPFVVGSLGAAEYGLYQLVASFAGYLGVLDFGIATTLARYVVKFRTAGQKENEENYLFMSFIQTCCFSMAVILIGAVLYFFLSSIFGGTLNALEMSKAKLLFIILVINTSLSLIDHYFWGIQISQERFVYNTSEKIIKILLRVCLITLLLKQGMDSIAIIAVDLALTVLMLTCDVIYAFKVLHVKLKYYFFDKSLFKETFMFAFFIFLQAMVNQITMNTDKVILGIMTTTTVVAVYAVAMQIFSIYNSLSSAVQSVFLPKSTQFVHSDKNGEQLTDFAIRPARIQFMLLGLALLGFVLIGKDFVLCWMGPTYLDAYYITLIIMIPGTIELTENIIVSIVLAKNKNGFRTSVLACIAVFNVITTIILIKMIGVMGAPIATAISYIIGHVIVMNIYYKKKIGINIGRFAKEVLKGTILALVITLCVSLALLNFIIISGWIGFFIKALIIVTIYGVALALIGLNQKEKGFVKAILKKIIFRK